VNVVVDVDVDCDCDSVVMTLHALYLLISFE